MPRVSVIIPTYNRSGMVNETIYSVLAQTEPDLEVIVVDDGSDDDTRKIIKAIEDDRVKYFYKDNGGPASARNLGLAKALGEYMAFLDSDDFWPKDYLHVVLSHLESKGEFGGTYSPITVVYPDGSKVKSYKKPEGKSGWITLDLFKRGFIWPSAAVIRSSVLENFWFDESVGKCCEDGDFFLRLSTQCRFLFVPDVEAFYRISEDSISTEVGVTCMRMLVLERFYFRLGGDEIVPAKIARRRFSHACRKVAENRRRIGARAAALKLYRRAIRYWPADMRLYPGLFKTLLLDSSKDTNPNWEMPEALGDPLGTNRFI